jgi:general secretion pathway protein J
MVRGETQIDFGLDNIRFHMRWYGAATACLLGALRGSLFPPHSSPLTPYACRLTHPSPLTPHSVHANARTGFTLIEMLVAISLLAMLAILSWRGFEHISAQRTRVDADTAETDRVLRTLAQMERDLAQRIPDALIVGGNPTGVLASALQLATDESGQVSISILRGYPNSPLVRSVTYWMENERLMRRLDADDGATEIEKLEMLDALRKFEIRLLVAGKWIESRELKAAAAGTRAVAIEIAIDRAANERYLQVLSI